MIKPLLSCSLLLGSVLLSGCGNDHHPDEDSTQAHAHGDDAPGTETHQAGALGGMSLNEGKKWAMDEHTRTAFAAMASSYLNTDHSSMDQNGLQETGANLQEQIKGLIQGCTMSGDAHNQLHIFLTGYMAAVDALAEHGGSEDAQSVEHYLKEYNDYFE